MRKTSISVPEMQRLLGMKKVEARKTKAFHSYPSRRENEDHARQL